MPADPRLAPDPSALTLLLVRHGRTRYNEEHRIQGWVDSEITERGMEGVRATAEWLRDARLQAAYASSSGRTLATAEAIVAHHPHVEVVPHDGLRELHFGVFEAQPEERTADRQQWLEVFRGILDGTHPGFPGGESARTYLDRVHGAFDAILQRHGVGDTVLVVSHGMTLTTALARWGSVPPRALGNASVTVVRVRDDGTPDAVLVGHDPSGLGVVEEELPTAEAEAARREVADDSR
ncbi:MAG TPA: histidine phosphatase family protein [Actinotalea sp.]|nr:histidine phosphatase family protein [Actinotalea sp.]